MTPISPITRPCKYCRTPLTRVEIPPGAMAKAVPAVVCMVCDRIPRMTEPLPETAR